MATSKPNVVLVITDDQERSEFNFLPEGRDEQGNPRNLTPHIDRLAGNGLRFNNFHNTSKCFPTRAALMTGQYAQRVGVSKSANSVFKNHVTLGDVLRTAGYKTLMVGKHHALEDRKRNSQRTVS